MAAASLAEGTKVWVPASGNKDESPYELAEVMSTNPFKCFLVASGGFAMPAEEAVFRANPSTENDNTALLAISDATLLANTRERFDKDKVKAMPHTPRPGSNPRALTSRASCGCSAPLSSLLSSSHLSSDAPPSPLSTDLHLHRLDRHLGQPLQAHP